MPDRLAYQPSPIIIIISQLLSLLLRKSVHHVVQDVIRRNSWLTCLDFRTKAQSNEKTRLKTNILLCLVQEVLKRVNLSIFQENKQDIRK